MTSENSREKFDDYAEGYDELHAASISASGESTDYFHRYKLRCLERLGVRPSDPVLDYGCGIGNLTEQLVRQFSEVHGFDPSQKSLDVAQRRAPTATTHLDEDKIPDAHFGVAVLSGVLHHVPPVDRHALLRRVRAKLRHGGRVVVFEHNPVNPLTQKAVRDCPFDDDAILLWPWQLPRLLRKAGFEAPRLDYIVFFPRPLALLRPLEPLMRRVVLGAQTMTVARKLPRRLSW